MKKFMALTALLMLGACGTVGNVVISDASLQEKAAFALNTTPDKVKISNRRATLDSIKFVATKGGKSYQCYITTVAGVISSDALCSGAGSAKETGGNGSCNALLKAAGRC